MARDPRFDVLFEPVPIGPVTLPNRFYQVPHCTGFGVEKPWTQAAHRAVKAEGGWGGVCTEYCAVSRDSDETPYVSARMWDDGDAEALRMMTDAVHAHGALAGIELSHTGAHGENSESRLPSLAPSQLAGDFAVGVVPKAMTGKDIRRVQDDWVRAAELSRDAGFDIVYVYGAHTYLPGQFLSPYYNRREDEYGGSLRNRARFWLETLERVREAVGADCAVACRVAVAAGGAEAGIDIEEGLGFVRMADDLVDLWDVNIGSIAEWALDSGPSRFFPEGWQLELTGRVREATAKPIVGVGRITDPYLMERIVSSGAWDLIGAARPSIADPFLPAKIRDGRLDEIRECIGCNICISRADSRRHLGCTQNPTAGEEHRRGWHPERVPAVRDRDREALVVGAGPAGLECAVTLARRGLRRVRLVEAAPLTGGCLRLISRLPGLGEWGRLVAWRTVQLRKLGNLELETDTRLDAADIRAAGAETVVLATGARWAADGLNPATRGPIPGAQGGNVLTPEQVVLDGLRPPGRRVAVYDTDGYFMAPALAELLAGEGYQVEFVTCHEQVSPFAAETLEDQLTRRRLHELGIAVHRGTTVTAIEPDALVADDEFGEPRRLGCDGVVLVTQRVSDDALWADLEDTPGVYRVGDCVAPRLLADAVFDGHRLARELESGDPLVALPYLRERPVGDRTPTQMPGQPTAVPAPSPRRRHVERWSGSADELAVRIAAALAEAGPDAVVAAGRGAGSDLAPYRRLAERHGARFAVTRPQVEAGRATRLELVGASSETVAPSLYIGFGVSGALPHIVGMAGSGTVIAVNTDPNAPIFEHADHGVVADAGAIVRALSAGVPG
ncbi:MAG TPA: FAD-binding protein [Gaiellales bacterium]|jgi:dimethylamine/trimethylamine dehydrogenase|nr:FAD-binding protein [Gaiellales bacterium]